jgi:predicted XRE-type DNA-binding protein
MEEKNIVKKVCEELKINQSELSQVLGVSTSAISEWNKGNIPKMAQLALKLMLENREQKNQLKSIKKIFAIIQGIK